MLVLLFQGFQVDQAQQTEQTALSVPGASYLLPPSSPLLPICPSFSAQRRSRNSVHFVPSRNKHISKWKISVQFSRVLDWQLLVV